MATFLYLSVATLLYHSVCGTNGGYRIATRSVNLLSFLGVGSQQNDYCSTLKEDHSEGRGGETE